MQNFRVRDGDLDIGPGRRAEMVSGSEKLLQDLTMWLSEPFGVGFTTPYFGSQLPDMVGLEDPTSRLGDIESEVRRILDVYQANQIENLREARDAGLLANWAKSEVLNDIGDVTAVADGDRVVVEVTITTAAGADLSLDLIVSEEGVNV